VIGPSALNLTGASIAHPADVVSGKSAARVGAQHALMTRLPLDGIHGLRPRGAAAGGRRRRPRRNDAIRTARLTLAMRGRSVHPITTTTNHHITKGNHCHA
jgi:hypothetical protein